jgi:hypothetical protein
MQTAQGGNERIESARDHESLQRRCSPRSAQFLTEMIQPFVQRDPVNSTRSARNNAVTRSLADRRA